MSEQTNLSSALSILLCEDEPLILSDTADVLRHRGHIVIETMTGADALTQLDPSIDILIADISLPDMSGVELAKLARKTVPHIAVIFATAHASVPEAAEVSSAVILAKPYGEEDLLRIVAMMTRENGGSHLD